MLAHLLRALRTRIRRSVLRKTKVGRWWAGYALDNLSALLNCLLTLFRSAVANDNVHLSMLDTLSEMVLVTVSLRESGGRIRPVAEALGNII